MTRIAMALALMLVAPALLWAQDTVCPLPDPNDRWQQVGRAWKSEIGLRWSNDSLRRVLLGLRARDQSARAGFAARMTDSAYVRELMALDSAISARVHAILDRFGFPTRAMVGAAGVDAVMLVVQHSEALQDRVFEAVQNLPGGQVAPDARAMLEDRVRARRGEPQRFGSHLEIGRDSVLRFAPTADVAGLEARRAGAGLPPISLYVCWLESNGYRIDSASVPRAPFLPR